MGSGSGGDEISRTTTEVHVDGSARLRLTRPSLLVEAGPLEGLEFLVEERPVVLGRAEEADIVLEDTSVSRRHAEIQPRDRGWCIRDLGSRSGTLVNGVRVELAELSPGARIRLGKTELVFALEETSLPLDEPEEEASFGLRGRSPVLRRVFQVIRKVAPLEMPVLIQGESGTGKEALARALHECRDRPEDPFVVVDCTLLDGDHLRSELFGHVKGAFTGADSDRRGAFEAAGGGTLFLDEVGELPLELQPMLLRALEQGEIRPLGGNRAVKVRTRVVSATNRDLREEARAGRFREDLMYRLAALRVEVPPLRDRGADVVELARGFLAEGSRLGPEAEEALARHDWPGNVRELRNVIQAACALAPAPVITPADLDLPAPDEVDGTGSSARTLEAQRDQAEARALREALELFEGNRTAVARHLGISRTTLWRRMRDLGIDGL